MVRVEQILRLNGQLEKFNAMWDGGRKLGPEALARMEAQATIESAEAMARIADLSMEDGNLIKVFAGEKGKSHIKQTDQETAGYAQVLKSLKQEGEENFISDEEAEEIHAAMYSFAGNLQFKGGKLKKNANHIASHNYAGKQVGIALETFDSVKVADRFRTFMIRMSTRMKPEKEEWPASLAAEFFIRFLKISPFQFGNQRVGMLMAQAILMGRGYDFVRYVSLEKTLEQDMLKYRRYMLAGAKGLYWEEDVIPPWNGDFPRRGGKQLTTLGEWNQVQKWVHYFYETLVKMSEELKVRMERELKYVARSELASDIMRYAQEQGRVTVKQLAEATGRSRNTVKRDLKRLVDDGLLVRYGEGRGSFYRVG